MTERWRPAARTTDVRAGDAIAATVDGIELAIGRDGDRFFAVQRRCVHRGGDLADGIVARGHLVCPQHGWRFSTETGCAADASEYCLATFPVRVIGDQIEVDARYPKERTDA